MFGCGPVKSLSKFESFGNPSKEKKKKREKSPLSFPGDSDGKEFVCNLGDLGSIPALGRSPGGGHATHCDSLGWIIPQTEETGGLQSTESQRVGHD